MSISQLYGRQLGHFRRTSIKKKVFRNQAPPTLLSASSFCASPKDIAWCRYLAADVLDTFDWPPCISWISLAASRQVISVSVTFRNSWTLRTNSCICLGFNKAFLPISRAGGGGGGGFATFRFTRCSILKASSGVMAGSILMDRRLRGLRFVIRVLAIQKSSRDSLQLQAHRFNLSPRLYDDIL